jgi:hypothetical protein
MAARGQNIEFTDFSGGLNTFDPEYNSDLNQSPDLDNIVILDKGFKKRNGDSEWNSTAMASGASAVTGLGYVKYNSGSEFLTAVSGTKFYSDSGLAGTMSDVTGAVSITAGNNNLWTPVKYNNLQIWFGGAPDAPFKYSGTGNAASLGGTPPSAYTGFAANNRVFALSTAANPSRIYWSVLSDPEDWTGTGSGNDYISKSDGDSLQCGVVLGTDTALLFKDNSTHLMPLTRAPFPTYHLQSGIGIAGRNAYAQVNGEVFFITPGKRMKSTTDGVNFKSYPNDINDLFDNINSSRVAYIQGVYYQNLNWIMWIVSMGTSSTNNYCIIWDLEHECFLRCTTGFKSNVLALVQNRRLFGGNYSGKIYEKLKSTVFSDASEATPYAIDGYWRSAYKNLGEGLDTTAHPLYISISALSESASTLDVTTGFDFVAPVNTQTFTLAATGAQWDVDSWDVGMWGGQNAIILRKYIYGRGNLFSFKLRNATASQGFTIQGCSIRSRTDKARRVFTGV